MTSARRRVHDLRRTVVPGLRGSYPGTSAITITEHALRDDLARMLHGVTEASVPLGRADVATATYLIEVEPWRQWRHGARQALAYAAQVPGHQPGLALFGVAHRDDVLKIYLFTRDRVPMALWWHDGYRWDAITSRSACRNMSDPT